MNTVKIVQKARCMDARPQYWHVSYRDYFGNNAFYFRESEALELGQLVY